MANLKPASSHNESLTGRIETDGKAFTSLLALENIQLRSSLSRAQERLRKIDEIASGFLMFDQGHLISDPWREVHYLATDTEKENKS